MSCFINDGLTRVTNYCNTIDYPFLRKSTCTNDHHSRQGNKEGKETKHEEIRTKSRNSIETRETKGADDKNVYSVIPFDTTSVSTPLSLSFPQPLSLIHTSDVIAFVCCHRQSLRSLHRGNHNNNSSE